MVIKEENIRFILGLKIKSLRKKQMLSLKDLSQKSGLSISYLNEIESGKKYPKGEKLSSLANALAIDYDKLVSIELDEELDSISKLLQSNLLSEIPFSDFGIDTGKVFDIISTSPKKTSAFIITFFELAKKYRLDMSQFLNAAMRSYLEINQNYDPKMEKESMKIQQQYHINIFDDPVKLFEKLKLILIDRFDYTIKEETFDAYQNLQFKKSYFISKNEKPILILNSSTHLHQQLFAVATEIGYAILESKERSYVYPEFKIKKISFETMINNYKASYFGAALLIPARQVTIEINTLFNNKQWDKKGFINVKRRFPVSRETFLHRLTSILPKFYGVNDLFFLKLKKENKSYHLVKELHIGGVQGAHSTTLKEHYCRRWASIKVMNDSNKNDDNIMVQTSKYHDNDHEYFCISMFKTNLNTIDQDSCITLGIRLNEKTEELRNFVKETPVFELGVTCERCLINDCKERVAPSTKIFIHKKNEEINSDLERFIKKVL